jgi:NAD(P)H dehydrogenase (quinone)
MVDRTRIEHVIFDYCGARVAKPELFLPTEDGHRSEQLTDARAIGEAMFRNESAFATAAA